MPAHTTAEPDAHPAHAHAHAHAHAQLAPSVGDVGPPERRRWGVLALFFVLFVLNSAVSSAFSAFPVPAQQYVPGLDNQQIDLLVNWGSIIFIPASLVVPVLAARPGGLRLVIVIGAVCTAVGAALRLVVCWMPTAAQRLPAVAAVHIGQIIAAVGGPCLQDMPSLLSVMWYPARQRSLATALAATSGSVGSAFAFLIGPYGVPTGAEVPGLLYIEAGLCAAALVLVVVLLPAQPLHPPSEAAARLRLGLGHGQHAHAPVGMRGTSITERLLEHVDDNDNDEEGGGAKRHAHSMPSSLAASGGGGGGGSGVPLRPTSMRVTMTGAADADAAATSTKAVAADAPAQPAKATLCSEILATLRDVGRLFRQPTLVVACIAGGLQAGVITAWATTLQMTLPPAGISADYIGFLVFGATLGGVITSNIASAIADRCLRQRLKSIIVLSYTLSTISLLLFTLQLPIGPYAGPIPTSLGFAMATNILGGLFSGTASPLFYELTAELAYPVPESSSAWMLMMFQNGFLLIALFAAPYIPASYMNSVATGAMIVCVVLISVVRVRYRRSEAEAHRRSVAHA